MSEVGDEVEDGGITYVCMKVSEDKKISFWAPKVLMQDEED